jgi:soluble lytic murein transglycosylase
MKVHNRMVFSIVFLVVLLCFAFISTRVAHREKVNEREAVSRIIGYLQNENVKLEDGKLRTLSETVYDESMRYRVDYRLVLAIMKIESNFRYDAVSKKGARGLLQVKPSLAKCIAEDIGIGWQGIKTVDEPETNIRFGVHLFSKLINDFQNTNMALHAYHVGPTRLRQMLASKKVPQKGYVNLVLDEYDRNISLLPPP